MFYFDVNKKNEKVLDNILDYVSLRATKRDTDFLHQCLF